MHHNTRNNWTRKVEQVIRSRHYGWLAEARDGDPIEDVMTDVAADVMHICKRKGISIDELLHRSRQQFEIEEAARERMN